MPYKAIGAVAIMGILAFLAEKFTSAKPSQKVDGRFYDFKMKSLEGNEIDFSRYEGKMIMVVNTASNCGYTYQYKDLQELHEKYPGKVEILGFPANNFLWQEPGSNDEIAAFCEKNYGVSFQMFEKISVKGRDQHPLFEWLEKKSGHKPSWNFCKYIINRKGEVIGFFPAKANPTSPEILKLLELQ
jgi:glutathione peroxidase